MGRRALRRDTAFWFLKKPSAGFRNTSAVAVKNEDMNETPDTQPPSNQTLSTQTGDTSIWRRKSTLAIGGVVGVVALLAGGIGIGAALGDDDDDDRPVAAQTQTTDDSDDSDDLDGASGSQTAPAGTSVGAADAEALIAVLSAARGESEGTVTSLETNRDGSWSVDLENDRGDETTVRVDADGAASVVRTEAADGDDSNDPAPAGELSDDNVAALVDAALGEAQGAIVDVDLDDQENEAYSVQVRADDGTETDIDLATDFSVTNSEVDRD